MQSNFKSSPKDFNLMVLGQIISILGSSLLRFALSLYVLDVTGRADLFATLFAISNIPLLLSGGNHSVMLIGVVMVLLSMIRSYGYYHGGCPMCRSAWPNYIRCNI